MLKAENERLKSQLKAIKYARPVIGAKVRYGGFVWEVIGASGFDAHLMGEYPHATDNKKGKPVYFWTKWAQCEVLDS